MTARAAAIVEVFRSTIASIETLDPAEQDLIIAAIVADLRARRPVAIAPMTFGPPTEKICDPRDPTGVTSDRTAR